MSNPQLRVCIAGASGRMGRMLIEAVQNADDCVLGAALDLPGSPALGQDASAFMGQASGVQIACDLDAIAGSDYLIDFTRPEGTMEHPARLRPARRQAHHRHHRLQRRAEGRDRRGRQDHLGRDGAQHERRRQRHAPLLEMAAKALNTGYDIEIVEGAPPPQGRCAQRYRAQDGRGDRRRAGPRPRTARSTSALATPASAIPAR